MTPRNRSPLVGLSASVLVMCSGLGLNVAAGTAFGAMPVGVLLEQGSAVENVWSRAQVGQSVGFAAPWSIAQVCNQDTSPFMASIDRVAARSDNPVQARRSLLLAIQMSNMCYASNLSPAEMEALIAATGLLPAGQLDPRDRFNLDTTIWTGDGLQGPSGRSTRARLTYSFPADGTTWGDRPDVFVTAPNSLNAALISNFGFQDVGREWIRQGLAAWKRVSGVELDEVGDSGIPYDTVTTRRSTVGDIRIGGNTFVQANGGTDRAGVLAYNFFPNNGGDMCIDVAEFTASRFSDPANNFRYFRNVIAHEHGHGLGFIHQVPCNTTKLMEPQVSTAFDVLQIDDRRGAAFGYGDRFSGNSTAALAADLGTLRVPAQPRRVERDLSMARLNGPAPSAAIEWFKFRLDSTQSVSILMVPRGGTYSTGQQQTDPNNASNACFGASGSINATSAIDLDMQLLDAGGTVVLASSTNGAGADEFISQTLAPGEYTIRIFSFLPDPGTAVQLYDLDVGITGALLVPYANAGLNKRINVGEFCQFMGDVNSFSGSFPINSYQWDLDGNGSLETINARPLTIYTTPGIRRVRLAVVDSNNGNSNDFINVTVIGSAPTVSSVSPNSGGGGSTVPVTINGSSLGSPTVTVSSGVTVIGTPSVDLTNINSPITGLSFLVDPNATAGPRNVTVTTPSGSRTLNNAFTITQPLPTIASISPSSGTPGQTIPIVINGSNFNGVQAVTITGPGTSFSGSPVVNPARTQITGLSVVIAANASPGARTVQVSTLGGFDTSTFTVSALAPANDLCANATALSLGSTVNGTNVGAGTEGSVATACATGSVSDVFYTITPDCTASYRFETGPSTFDTVLSVHTACSATGANSIACNDDVSLGILNSRVDVTLTAGTNYIVRVSSFNARPTGAFTLSASPTTPLANDTCAGAISLPVGQTSFDTCLAATEGTGITSCVILGKDVWHSFIATGTGRTTIDTCGSLFDTVLEVFNTPCGSTTAIACSDDACSTQSRVSFNAVAGTTYSVRVSGFRGSRPAPEFGAGTLTRYCPADINLSRTVTVQDIFDFLAAWFAGSTTADFNGVGGVTVQDIFDFLAAWFAGC